MQLRIRSITYLAEDVLGFELTDPSEHDLPRFTAGAHIAIRVAPGLLRDYSLCNDPAERRRYCIAVLKETEGYGSNALHAKARVGDRLEVSWPRNLFPLVDEAERHWLIAGGIGITPFMAMIAELKRRRADFHLHYCSRAPERTAFREELSLLAAMGRVTFHYDGGDPAKGLDVAALLKEPPPGTHLYYCGPAGLMDAVARAATHWPPRTVHCEYFKGPAAAIPEMVGEDLPFRVRLARQGGEYEVRADESIARALRRHGVKVDTSCELGYCGTCLTRYLSGEPDFRDQILNPADRKTYVLTCCTRAKGDAVLELDL
ncbi:MAG TPA: PDR/VanB family oxidoreductase [Stellaceae bacterium]|nr:PDR/VanB family oxidoreductase [Stellaceae bacterium]